MCLMSRWDRLRSMKTSRLPNCKKFLPQPARPSLTCARRWSLRRSTFRKARSFPWMNCKPDCAATSEGQPVYFALPQRTTGNEGGGKIDEGGVSRSRWSSKEELSPGLKPTSCNPWQDQCLSLSARYALGRWNRIGGGIAGTFVNAHFLWLSGFVGAAWFSPASRIFAAWVCSSPGSVETSVCLPSERDMPQSPNQWRV